MVFFSKESYHLLKGLTSLPPYVRSFAPWFRRCNDSYNLLNGAYAVSEKNKKGEPRKIRLLLLLFGFLFQQMEDTIADKHPEDYAPNKCNK